MLNFILILAYFPLRVLCDDDFIVLTPVGEDIPYTHVDLYRFSEAVKNIDSGKPVETLDEVVAVEMLKHTKLCEVTSRNDSEGAVLHMPALCHNSCENEYHIHTPQTDACQKRFGANRGSCCPADKIPFYRNNFPEVNLEQHELPSYRFHHNRFSVDWSIVNVHDLSGGTPSTLFNEEEFQAELERETVCGVRQQYRQVQEIHGSHSEIEYIIFFCIEASKCTAHVRNVENNIYVADPLWDEFCSNKFRRDLWDVKFLDPNPHRCCHTNYFPDTHFKRKYTNLKFRSIPVNLKYAPGLRSNFMCEVYSRIVCGKPPNSEVDECAAPETPLNRPGVDDAISIRDAPYIARIGVVAPHVLIFHCLGSIVSQRFIISVALCSQVHGINTNIAIVGEDDTDDIFTGDKINVHEQLYVISEIIKIPNLLYYEPTLYKTSKEIQFNPRVRPACLHYNIHHSRPTEGVLSYFGKLRDDNYKGQYLRQQKVGLENIENFTMCTESRYRLDRLNERYRKSGLQSSYEYCGDGIYENKACKYDRGSPLVKKLEQPYCSWLILGLLTSERWNCEQPTPQAFTNTTVWLSLIEDIVWPLPFLEVRLRQRTCRVPQRVSRQEETNYYWKLLWRDV